jgi:hypothetical protein
VPASYRAAKDGFRKGDLSFQIPKRGGNFPSSNDLQSIASESKQDAQQL